LSLAHFDITIVGGGMVGASLARALLGVGLSVAVIESFELDAQQQPSYDDRAIALSYTTRRILEAMGIWSKLAQQSCAIKQIHISNKGHFGFTRLNAQEQGVSAFGYVATGHVLGHALLQDLEKEAPHVTLFCPAKIEGFQVTDDQVTLQLNQAGTQVEITSNLLVAADGAQSMVRQQLAIDSKVWQYGQTAIISNITPSKAQQPIAYERFTDHGPMAMLPLGDSRYGMVWTVADNQLDELMALDDGQMIQRIQQYFGFRLGKIEQIGQRQTYPLQLMLAKQITHQRVVLIGNAAHAVHPITGQGFNLGMRDIATLAEVLADAYKQQQDIGSAEPLKRYSDARKWDHQQISLVTDGLVRLFTNPLLPIQVGRNLGLNLLDMSPSIKRGLARQFMGLNSQLPRLARGLSLETI